MKKVVNLWNSLGTKLCLLFIVFVSAFVTAVGLMSYRTASSAIIRQAETGLLQTLVQAGEKMDMQLRFYQELANQLMRNAGFTENLFQFAYPDLPADERQRRIAATRHILDQLTLSDAYIRDIHLIPLEDPVPVISTNRETAEIAPDAPWLAEIREAAGEPVWFPAAEGGYAGPQAMAVFAFGQLFNRQNVGSSEYALLVQVDAAVLTEMVSDIRLGGRSAVAVADREGRPFVVHTETFSGLAGEGSPEIAAPSVAQEQEEGHLVREGGNGKEIVLYRRSPVSGWVLFGTVPQAEITAPARGIQATAWAAVCVSILLAAAVAVWAALWLRRRLERLKTMMDEASAGNFSGRLRQPARDEIGLVSAAYDRMAERIGELVGEIRQVADQVAAAGERVTEAARHTALSAKEIQSASEQIASGAEQLAIQSESNHLRVGEMNERLLETDRFQQNMAATAREVDEACRTGSLRVRSLLGRTEETETRLAEVGERLMRLRDGMDSIHRILELLTQIARQTTILALNAAIEAARSGGKQSGFRVIADEIRKLAEQANLSIREAGELMESLRTGVFGAAAAMTETMPFFRELAEHVHDVCGIFDEVQENMNRLMEHTREVGDAVTVMRETQAGLARSAEETAAVSEEASASSRQVAALCAEQRKISEELVMLAENMREWSARLNQHLARFQV